MAGIEQEPQPEIDLSRRNFLGMCGYALGWAAMSRYKPELLPTPWGEKTADNLLLSDGEDPSIELHDGRYYFCCVDTTRDRIQVTAADTLRDIGRTAMRIVWDHPPHGVPANIWAPEIRFMDKKWYIYYAAQHGDQWNRRMHVVEGLTAFGPYKHKGVISAETDKWAIDGIVLRHDDQRYFVWSGWEGDRNGRQDLYIAAMGSPWSIVGDRTCISTPQYRWEKRGRVDVNEAPAVLQHEGRTFIVYSASGSWTDHYCLGLLELVGSNPLDPAAWKKFPKPVFKSLPGVYAPGSVAFTESPDGCENWMLYTAAKHKGSGWDREVRLQRFGWNVHGTPDFGEPA